MTDTPEVRGQRTRLPGRRSSRTFGHQQRRAPADLGRPILDIGGTALYFRISSDSVELAEPSDFTAFYAVCPPGLADGELVDIVRREDLGDLLPGGGHLMVPLETVRRLAAGRVGPDWARDFDSMIAYAAGKGWLSEDGTRVRAHVESEKG